jgi:nucleolar protein 53
MMDTQGDGKTQKELRKNRPLKMDEILAERSKIPAVSGRHKAVTTSTPLNANSKPNAKISKAEKARLLDMIKRRTSTSLFAPVNKPLGRSGMTDAVKAAGRFDVWESDKQESQEQDQEVTKGESDDEMVGDFVSEIVTKVAVKAPRSFKQKQKVSLPAVKKAHPGASYNPTMQDHQGLLRLAHNEELRILNQKEKIDSKLAYPKELDSMVAFDDQTGGLLEDSDDEEEEEEEEEEEGEKGEAPKTKKKGKKSIAERNRLARAAETAKKEAEIKRHKELIKQTNRVKDIMKTVEQEEAEMEAKRLENEQKKEEKEKAGMKRVGRFK